jgi:predicted transcriptional regulator
MSSVLSTKLSVDTLKQPMIESTLKFMLSAVDPAGTLSALFPIIGPIAAIPIRTAQEGIKSVIDQRDRDRMTRYLAEAQEIVSAIQDVNLKTYEYVVKALDILAIRLIYFINDHQSEDRFLEAAAKKLGCDATEIQKAITELDRLGLVSARLLFEHRDRSFREFPDINWATDYAESRCDKLRDQIAKLQNITVINSKAEKPDVRIHSWQIQLRPSLTFAGVYILGLFDVVAADVLQSSQ